MNPDKKYMTKNKEEDLKLVPFMMNQDNKDMPLIGWIPIFILNKDNKKAVPANAMILPSNISNLDFDTFNNTFGNTLNLQPFDSKGLNLNMQPWNPSNSSITPPDSINANYDKSVKNATSSPNVFPEDYSSDDLFIYNTQGYTSSNNRLDEKVTEILKNLDFNLDEDTDLIRHCSDKRIEKIYDIIEKNHPEICALMDNYNIPSPISKLIIRRTIKVALEHCKG
ncbi:hypothetical protein [uncultured Clostridium sp.]|uniref:hypothetical protein n=1 Tax=uncultured Clostridium sp. TaxID=59620 RepID=UPI0025DD2F2A|nr:hypothetical protein [uncultured Clostridium sp.]